MEIDSSAESVKYRSPPRKNSPRAVSATDSRHDQGIAMFRRRAQDIHSEVEGQDSSSAKQLLLTDLESLNTLEKTTLAETLRAVEIEKHLASEERFKGERERLKLEEERKRFEEEKKLFQDQMRKLQALEQTKT